MSLNDENKLNRIEDLKSKLFRKNYQTKIKHRNIYSHSYRKEVPDSWKEESTGEMGAGEKFFMKTSWFKKFFIFSIIFFVLTIGYGAYIFFAGGNVVSNDNIDISILGNNFTAGGEDLSLIVGVTNKNNASLELVDLVAEYPKGGSADLSSDTERIRVSLGTIPAGAVRNENIKVVLFGEQGSVRPIKISIEYRVAGSNAIFVKDKLFEVTISSTPINLSVDAPTTITPNQEIVLKVKETLNSTTETAKGVLLLVDYPVGFSFIKAEPAPSSGNNVWNLGDLAPGVEHNVTITGKMIDVFDGEEKTFNVSTGSQSDKDKNVIGVVFNAIKSMVTVKKPFVDANLYINGISQREYAVNTKTPITGEIRYVNNLDTKIESLRIVAKLTGNAFDRRSVKVQNGFYDSTNDTITWDQSSKDALGEINPGDSGTVNFSITPLTLYSSSGGMLSDPTTNIEIDISGKQSTGGFATTELQNSSSAIVRTISDVGFSAKALYYSGPFVNTGPIPPVAEKATTYTITWTLSNTSNSISKVQINSTLPPWVTFLGQISPSGEDLVYNSSTKGIVWNVDRIPRGTGITTAARSVSFQVSFTPSLSQVDSDPPIIINDAILTGHDDFANVDVKVNKINLSTRLNDDPMFPANGGQVVAP
ncbi:MAG: hypothetical protein WC609_01940 [Candidatus Paceibacterota bacterium]|jgi:hypothetical protein